MASLKLSHVETRTERQEIPGIAGFTESIRFGESMLAVVGDFPRSLKAIRINGVWFCMASPHGPLAGELEKEWKEME